MVLPIAPLAGVALRYGVVAVAAFAVTRRVGRAHFDQRCEEAMNDVNEGVALRKENNQVNGTGRFRRVIRVGTEGPGLEIDITALGRVKFRKI